MWFTEAHIKIIFVKLIFKTFTLEISKKKGPNILPRPGIRNLYLLFTSSSQDSLFSPEQIARYISSVEKKNNGEEDEKILFDAKNNSPKIVWSSR